MLKDFFNRHSLVNVQKDHLSNEILKGLRGHVIFRKLELPNEDLLVKSLHFFGLKRNLTKNEEIKKDSKRPNVRFVANLSSSSNHLRSQISRGSSCVKDFPFWLDDRRDSKVDDFWVEIFVQKNVVQFDVPMDDTFLMETLDTQKDPFKKEFEFLFR